jgi:hypothetical protein
MTVEAPCEVVPSVAADLILPKLDGLDPSVIAIQYKVPPVRFPVSITLMERFALPTNCSFIDFTLIAATVGADVGVDVGADVEADVGAGVALTT